MKPFHLKKKSFISLFKVTSVKYAINVNIHSFMHHQNFKKIISQCLSSITKRICTFNILRIFRKSNLYLEGKKNIEILSGML